MDTFYSYPSYPAVVKFSTIKHCFLIIPAKWAKDFHGELLIFKILFGENKNKEAFISCGKDFSNSSDLQSKIFLNQKFAEKLGLKEKETVVLEPVLSNIPKAIKIVVEPLTSDDWEILEHNASTIEKTLMNQIRVVWTDQIFPVWVQNYCFCKVVACEPNHKPVLLCENSEVSIVPKDRYQPDTMLQQNKNSEKTKPDYFQFQFLRNCSKPDPYTNISDSDESYKSSFSSSDSQQAENNLLAIPYNLLTSWFSSPKEESNSLEEPESLREIYQFNFDSVLRVLPYTNPEISIPTVVQATTVFIAESTYVACCGDKEIPPCFIGVLEKYALPEKKLKKSAVENGKNIPPDNSASNNTDKTSTYSSECQKTFGSLCVTVIVIKSNEDEFTIPPSLFIYKNAIVVPKEIKRALNLEVGCLVHLRSAHEKPLSSYRIIFHPVTTLNPNINEKNILDHFKLWAFGKKRKHYNFVISDGTLVKLKIHSKKCEFFIHLQERGISDKNSLPDASYNSSSDSERSISLKSESDYGLLTNKLLKRTPIIIGAEMCLTIYDERPFLLKETGMYCEIKAPKLTELGGIKELSIKAIEDIQFWLKLRPSSYVSNHTSMHCGCILICGPKGVGKSSFANALCKKFAAYPYHILVRSVNCLSLKGKRVDVIAKKWDDIVSEAIYGQPSLVLFEDLDYIASSPLSQEQENGPDGVYFSCISQAFINMMLRITSSESKVVVIVTSQSLHSLHPSLVNTKGRHIFQSILEVNPPNTEQRAEIIHVLLKNKHHISKDTSPDLGFLEIASKTEGYVAQDLNILVDKATHAAWIRLATSHESDQITLINDDFDIAMKSMVPSSLRGVSLQMQEQRTWNDVGGLSKVKKVIQQIIMWPTKYKQMYKDYSLKPQTNILLYGAPGTGKTLLASVVANECGLNFISIKGPELLSKYIGASEQSVRDLFKRATTAKPCILFFDEFDSIAPRRGHDSTGVTDRVVNQLLTQLDGVESLEGVHVLAATSRPELIDPALLRPGRLDKCLLCPLPDKNERVEILHCLSSKLNLYEDVDFEAIASLTDNFSGADLQALLYTAHIEALHEVQYTSSKHYRTDSQDSDYRLATDKLLYIPKLEEGLKTPSYEDEKKIVQDVAVVSDKYFGGGIRETRRRSILIVSINQRHLLKVASEMKPSVSAEERLRYEFIFKDFQNVLSGKAPASPGNIKRVTLA